MKIGRIEMRQSVAELSTEGWTSENENLESFLNLTFGRDKYSPSHGTFGVKLLKDAAEALGARVVMEPDPGGEDTVDQPQDDELGTSEKLASFFGLTVKESSCGANAPGGGGFQPGNSCGDDEGDGTNEDEDNWHPDKDALIAEDGPSQHPDLLHNIKTDPTKEDRAELWQYAKDVATFKIRDDSLLKRAIKELTTDPTKEDRGLLLGMVGDTLKLKPVRDFVTGKNRAPNPAMSDLKEITAPIRKIVNGTVGNLFRLIGRGAKASMGTGEALPDGVLNRVLSHPSAGFVRGFTKASEADQQNIVEQVTDEVMRRVGKNPTAAATQEAILDVMEEVLAGDYPDAEPEVQKASGISGTTGESGGFVQASDEFADRDSDWLNHEFDPDDADETDRRN